MTNVNKKYSTSLHTFLMALIISSISPSFLFMVAQRFSMGLRLGLLPGHSILLIFLAAKKSATEACLWQGAWSPRNQVKLFECRWAAYETPGSLCTAYSSWSNQGEEVQLSLSTSKNTTTDHDTSCLPHNSPCVLMKEWKWKTP